MRGPKVVPDERSGEADETRPAALLSRTASVRHATWNSVREEQLTQHSTPAAADGELLFQCWELSAFLCGLYCIFSTPFRVSFMHLHGPRSLWVQLADGCIDLVSSYVTIAC